MNSETRSAVSHLIGAVLAVIGMAWLITAASLWKSAWHVAAFAVFGVSLLMLYLMSALYHFLPSTTKAKAVFKRLDYAMIYVLIAGTYTAGA